MNYTLVGCLTLALAAALPAQQKTQPPATRADSVASATRGTIERQKLERRLHERVARVVRDLLELSEEQAGQLSAASQRYDDERRGLIRRERTLRLELRKLIRARDNADQKRVADLLDQAMRIQQERLDLLRKEQSDIAAFLTPVQRAKYMALQEQMRQRVDELRHRGARRGARPEQRDTPRR